MCCTLLKKINMIVVSMPAVTHFCCVFQNFISVRCFPLIVTVILYIRTHPNCRYAITSSLRLQYHMLRRGVSLKRRSADEVTAVDTVQEEATVKLKTIEDAIINVEPWSVWFHMSDDTI